MDWQWLCIGTFSHELLLKLNYSKRPVPMSRVGFLLQKESRKESISLSDPASKLSDGTLSLGQDTPLLRIGSANSLLSANASNLRLST